MQRQEIKIVKCRSCDADMIFMRNSSDTKWLPINSESVGEYDLNATGVPIYNKDYGHEPHWATCPYAKDFRKQKGETNVRKDNSIQN